MRTLFRTIFFASAFLAATIPALAQIPKVQSDPLHPTQMIQGAGACSATEVSSCAQAAAKITPIVMGESPLEENLRRLTDEIGGRISGSPEMARLAPQVPQPHWLARSLAMVLLSSPRKHVHWV